MWSSITFGSSVGSTTYRVASKNSCMGCGVYEYRVNEKCKSPSEFYMRDRGVFVLCHRLSDSVGLYIEA